jgi:hypothetical protein
MPEKHPMAVSSMATSANKKSRSSGFFVGREAIEVRNPISTAIAAFCADGEVILNCQIAPEAM